jgi:hypothetical protein
MAMVDADWTIDRATGAIRYIGDGHDGVSPSYATVIQFHRWVQAFADDATSGASDDEHDITDDTATDRATDNIIKILSPYNIDDTAAEHLFDGSIEQGSNDSGNNDRTIYAGIVVVGSVADGTIVDVVQDHKRLKPFWGSVTAGIALNGNLAANIITRFLVKVRDTGAAIDGQRLRFQARELNDGSGEFAVTAALGNNTAALFTGNDNFHNNTDATIEGWSSIVNTEGFQELNIDGTGAAGQEFYSQWDKGLQAVNDVYERSKWIQQRPHVAEASGDQTGTDYVIDNATIVGQGQEFQARGQAEKLTSVIFDIKVAAGTPIGTVFAELIDSDAAATAIPQTPFTVLATSEVIDVSRFDAAYQATEFMFNDNVTLTASQDYFIVLRNPDADASNNLHVRGNAAGTFANRNKAEENPASTWTGQAAADLEITVNSSPVIHSQPGIMFRGITHEVLYDTEAAGPFNEAADEIIFWGTDITYDTLVGTFAVGEYVRFDDAVSGDTIASGKVLDDNGTTLMRVALEDSTGSILADNDVITGISSGATAAINVTITNDDASGGEGILLALDDNGLTGEFYIQLISGAVPDKANLPMEGRTSAATAQWADTVNSKTVSAEFLGTSTGSNILGAYGIGFEPADVGASDQFQSLDDATRTPPNNVQFDVIGVVVSEDRVLVGPEDGAAGLDRAQLTLNTSLLGATETAIVTTVAIPVDTPATGTIRVQLDTGTYRLQSYTSYTGSTFTIPSTDYSGANNATQPRNIFVSYIDKLATATTESFTTVYNADRTLFIRVRDGGGTPIKTFESTSVLGSTGGSSTVNRITDV